MAPDLAGEHGVFRTAQALHLDYAKLKRQTQKAARGREDANCVTRGLYRTDGPLSPRNCECVIEVEGPRGRMRIGWKGSTTPDLVSLGRALWEPGA